MLTYKPLNLSLQLAMKRYPYMSGQDFANLIGISIATWKRIISKKKAYRIREETFLKLKTFIGKSILGRT